MPTLSCLSLSLSAAVLVSALLSAAGNATDRRRLVYVFKPLTTCLLIALAATAIPAAADPRYAWAILAGLVASLFGDVFLMLPTDRFRAGLASFLVAHVFYCVAFLADSPPLAPAAPMLAWGAFGAIALATLWPGIPGPLRIPVVAYVGILLLMAGQAGGRAINLATAPAALAAAGAGLFVVSDLLLAWGRFRRPLRLGHALVHATYFAAQWLIAASLL